MNDAMTEIEALVVALSRLTSADKKAAAVLRKRLILLKDSAARAARPYTHKVVGMRHYSRHEDEFQSLDEAIGNAYWAIEYNTYYPKMITDMNGVVVLDRRALDEAMTRYGAKSAA